MKIVYGLIILVVISFVSFLWSPGMYVAKGIALGDTNGKAENIKILSEVKQPDGSYEMSIYYVYNNKECISKGRLKLEGFTNWHTSGFYINCK